MPISDSAWRILAKCAELEEILAASGPPDTWKTWLIEHYQDEVEFGPQYSPSLWFGPMPDAERQKLLRAVHELGEADLLNVTRISGTRISHLKTTEAGRAALASRPDEEPAKLSANRQLVIDQMKTLVESGDDPRIKIAASRVLLLADGKGAKPATNPPAQSDLEAAIADGEAQSLEAQKLIDEMAKPPAAEKPPPRRVSYAQLQREASGKGRRP